jgi:hypothetical protein
VSEESRKGHSKNWGVENFVSQSVTQPTVSPLRQTLASGVDTRWSAGSGLSILEARVANVTDKVTEITD